MAFMQWQRRGACNGGLASSVCFLVHIHVNLWRSGVVSGNCERIVCLHWLSESGWRMWLKSSSACVRFCYLWIQFLIVILSQRTSDSSPNARSTIAILPQYYVQRTQAICLRVDPVSFVRGEHKSPSQDGAVGWWWIPHAIKYGEIRAST